MKKEAEIKLIEQIEKLVNKLIKGDTYFKDDLFARDFDPDDFKIMVSNIKNDFPLFFKTSLVRKIATGLDIYKERLAIAHKVMRGQSFSIRAYEHSIQDLEAENKALRVLRTDIARELIYTIQSENNDDIIDRIENALKLLPDDLIIELKMELNYPLTKDEIEKVKTALNYRS